VEIFKTLMVIVQLLSALGIIGLVLLQQGKGAEMGAAFGAGTSGSLFGAAGSANFLSRTTALLATLFFTCTLLLTFLNSRRPEVGGGVMATAVVSGAASAPVLASSVASSVVPK
jgi:preprotein translocase subunit SecG